ncbi:autotransporter assembly complex protein TamA [Maricaulis maris]|uniref:Autotransporter secretion outer membrane protein TamA n=1 Tax=Maricaulis maris TaxID=74318 RepID=A0A495D2U6_9PROT|nr:autotransporter assembly complex family protein [Maricaulis maris]RKQ96099.1 autotransporter secretion outer membrane protein TamA [Maricaulis maris]
MRAALLPALVLLSCAAAHAEPLARVQGVRDSDLLAALEAAIGERDASADLPATSALRDARTAADRARRLLRSRGYYAARVDTFVDDAGGARLRVLPGPQFTIGRIDVNAGDDAAARGLALASIPLTAGAPLLAQPVIDAEARALRALQNDGWPDAELLEREVVIDHAGQDGLITFRFQPGPFSRYGEVSRDTGVWDPQFIARISPLIRGDVASREDMLAYQRRLDSLASVQSARVTLGPEVDGSEERSVEVSLTEAERHTVETGLSYSTSEGAGGDIRWTRRNVFGNDETLTLSATLATLNQSATARLERPHWRRHAQTLFLHSGLTRETTDAYDQDEVEVGVEIIRRSDQRRTYGAGVSLDSSQVTDVTGERDIQTAALSLSGGYDSRNDPLDPTEGLRATLQVTPALTFGDEDGRYVSVEARASGYHRLSETVVAATRLRVGSVLGTSATSLAADQRFFAGGGGSARGFEYQSLSPIGSDDQPFGGLSVVEVSTELRWRVTPQWGAVAFVDNAIATDSHAPELGGMRTAIGFGARYYFDFAPVRIDIATPLDRRSGEPTVQIYLSLGQAF